MPYSRPENMAIPVAEVKFAIREYAARWQIPESQLESRAYMDHALKRAVIELVRKVAYIEGEGTLTIDVPATWWQHLKRTLYANLQHYTYPYVYLSRWTDWIVRRWPVRYETMVYKACAMFPNLPIPADRPEFEIGFFDWKGGWK